ncbi:MAG: YncE family protein [Chlamydiota bacterium]
MRTFYLFFLPLTLFSFPPAYVSQRSLGAVGTFDTRSGGVGVTIAVEEAPQSMAFSPDGEYLYVVNTGSESISVIQTRTYKKCATMHLTDPAGIAISSSGDMGYVVSHDGLHNFSIPDNKMGKKVASIAGYGSRKLVLSRLADKAYIALTDAICCVDIQEGVSMNLSLEGRFDGMCLSPDESLLCVVSTLPPFPFYSIDTKTNRVLQKIPLEGIAEGGRAIVMTHDGEVAYVLGEATGNIVPIFLNAGFVGDPIPTGTFPKDAAITDDGATIFVANFISDDVTPIDVATGRAGAPICLEDECLGIAIKPVTLVQELKIAQSKSSFLSTDIYTNRLSWKKADKASTQSFRIWKNGRFIQEISAEGSLLFEDYRIKKGAKDLYAIAAVSTSGTLSRTFSIEAPE